VRPRRESDRPLVRSRAPLRLGLAGGGTDVSPFCDRHGGYVLNATIDLYAYATLELLEEPRVVLEAADHGARHEGPADGEPPASPALALHWGTYRRIVRDHCGGVPFGMRLVTSCDAPPGSGLGSSSTLVVAMLGAFAEALNLALDEYETAHLAYAIERVDLGLAGGKQDQYSAAFGGVNFMEFGAEDRVLVNPLRVKPWILSELETSLLLFFTGVSRSSAAIIEQQVSGVQRGSGQAIDALLQVREEALLTKAALLRGDFSVFVDSMRRSWEQKKRTADSISNATVERVFDAATEAGALAGKVSGAGGGGFTMFFVDPARRPSVIRALETLPGQVFRCHFTGAGCQAWRVR